ncbi:MAG: TetR/AcrR family transcriptional regulator [Hyphomonadaceae bacterium]
MPAVATKKRPRLGPGRLSAEDAAGLPDRLMDAAFALFTEQGFEGATMDAIAKRAGASTKTLYSRYANKAEILEATVKRNVERTVASHLRGFALRPEETEPREYLVKFGMQIGMSNIVDETAGLVRITMAEGHRYKVLTRMYREVTGRAINAVTVALRYWREQGLIAFDEDAELLAHICFGSMTNEMRIRSVLGDPMNRTELERYVNTSVDLFLRALPPTQKKSRRK